MKETIVITGASSGLGKALAEQYVKQGAHVCLIGRTKERLEAITADWTGTYSLYECDISHYVSVQRTFHDIFDQFGSIHMLFNNAGVGYFAEAEAITHRETEMMLDINLKGTIYCTQAVLPKMKKENKGTIVNVISTAGKVGKKSESVYCASKFGVRGFTESLQVELQELNIRVIDVYMGGMDTPFWKGTFTEEQTAKLMDAYDVAEVIMENVKARPLLNVAEIVIKNKK